MSDECAGGSVAVVSNDVTPAMFDKLDGVISGHRDKPGSLIPVLQKAQDICGYLPAEVQRYVAEGLSISPSMVYGVVSFYSFFTMTPRGKYTIRVCLGTACYVKRAEDILERLEKALGIEVGGVTEDQKFSLEGVRCLGCCGLAPVAMVGEDTHGLLEPGKALDLLKHYE
jgi:NADH:ubiquinone oxidoreductase subunit E